MNYISQEIKGHVLMMGLNRAEKMNAFNVQMLQELSESYSRLEDDSNLRCGLLFSHGDHFTAGLDLGEVAASIKKGHTLFPGDQVDPLQLFGRKRTKPVVVAVSGYALTIAIELILANDICVASSTTKFGQIEIKRGIFPFGGATIRFSQRCGWGNAMRYLLTGDMFDAGEALRIGLIQEITEGSPIERGMEIANTIASQAPLGVQASLTNAATAIEKGKEAARDNLMPTLLRLMDSEDAREGINSFLERREAVFKGK
ncbi:MAG: crotonase/enoyl-CoA hydratase family protein [Cyclobacteriaceae bacterium]|nr:crotonase/enoyl-CoA hydratase family protein [Cyclobacteriaceae bacterium]